MAYKNILLNSEGHIFTITVNRPDVLNALNLETIHEMKECVAQVSSEKSCRVIIITGAGPKSFVSGADIAAMRAMGTDEANEFSQSGHGLMREIEASPKPVIAAVNGYALGGGTELALACDIVIASENAKFGLPEVKLGIYPGFGGTQRLARLIGPQKAKELIFTGKIIDAKEALQLGLASRIVPAQELMNDAKILAAQIASNGPLAVAAAKSLVNHGMNLTLSDALDSELSRFSPLFETKDRIEGMTAFLEKRKPEFTGS